jgi:acyl carrier protein
VPALSAIRSALEEALGIEFEGNEAMNQATSLGDAKDAA